MRDFHGRLIFVLMLAFVCLAAAGRAAAQASLADCETVYKTLLDNRKGPELEKYKLAISAGKEYLAKCSSLEDQVEVKTFVTKQIPKIEETVRIAELEKRFNTAVPGKNWDDAFASGKELIAANHVSTLDIMIALASAGYANAAANPPVDKYNSEALSYAKTVLQKLTGGSTSKQYGVYQFAYTTMACPDGRANAVSWMNYTIGTIMYKRQKQVSDAIPYLVNASQSGCELKDYPEIYRSIGAWYIDDARKLNASRAEKIKAAGDQETDETRSILALLNGYTDRAINAYARALRIAKDRTDLPAAYKDALYKKLQDLFDSRYDGNHDGVDKMVATVMNMPFPDPATPVAPVVEAAPAAAPAAANAPPKRP